jgi:hypothetical protein
MGVEPAGLVRDPAYVHHPVHGLVGDLCRPLVFEQIQRGEGEGLRPFAPTIRGNSLNEDYVSVPVFPGAGDSIRIEVDKLRGNRVDASHG